MNSRSERRFRPGARDWAYLNAVKQTLKEPGTSPRTRLMQLAGFKTRAGLLQFERCAERMAWVADQLRAGHEQEWELLVEAAYTRAMAGDFQWAMFFAQAIGRFPPHLKVRWSR